MLSDYLKRAIKDLDALIKLTKEDIEDIKKAKHDNVFKHTRAKQNLILSFEANKALLDNELVLLVKQNKDKELVSILSNEENSLLEKMKNALTALHKANKEYAKFVVTISEFYNSMIDNIIPSDEQGYQKPTPKPASFLKVRV